MISAIAVTPDSRYIIGGGGSKRDHPGHILFWDFQTGDVVRSDAWNHYELESILVTPDNQFIVVSGRDDHVIRDGTHYLMKGSIETGDYQVIHAARTFDLDLSFTWDRQYIKFGDYLWDWKKEDAPFLPGGQITYDGTLKPKVIEWTREYSITSDDETYLIRNVETGQVLRRLDHGHNNKYHAQYPIRISPDNRYLFAQRGSFAHHDEILCMWDLESGAIVKHFEACTGLIKAIDLTSDGQYCIVAILNDVCATIQVIHIAAEDILLKIEHEYRHEE